MMIGSTVPSPQMQGGPSCPVPLAHVSYCPPNSSSNSKPSSAPALPRKPWSFVAASSSAPPATTGPTTSTSRPNWAVIGTRSACGGSVSSPRAWLACKTPRAPVAPGAFPPDALTHVLNLASSKTEAHDRPASRWTLDELACTIVNEAHHPAPPRATLFPAPEEPTPNPHQSVYWLNSHDPDFDHKANYICNLYVAAPRL